MHYPHFNLLLASRLTSLAALNAIETALATLLAQETAAHGREAGA